MGRFLLIEPCHLIDWSYQFSTGRHGSPCRLIIIFQAIRIRIPSLKYWLQRLISRSWCVPQYRQSHSRTSRVFLPAFFHRQNKSYWMDRIYLLLWLPSHTNQPGTLASAQTLTMTHPLCSFASLWFFTMFLTCRSSIQMISLSLIIRVRVSVESPSFD